MIRTRLLIVAALVALLIPVLGCGQRNRCCGQRPTPNNCCPPPGNVPPPPPATPNGF